MKHLFSPLYISVLHLIMITSIKKMQKKKKICVMETFEQVLHKMAAKMEASLISIQIIFHHVLKIIKIIRKSKLT